MSENFIDLINKLTVKDPNMRLRSAEEVLAHPWFGDIDMEKLENKELINPWTEEAFN